MKYRVDKEYPEIKVEGKNKYYAELLLDDYAGINSELTAITRYIFQDFNYFKEYLNLAETLGKISMVEMKHLELLGKTIKLLGVEPKFKFNTNQYYTPLYWNSSYVNYDIFIDSMLRENILSEQNVINNYRYHITIIGDKYIKNLLERIIEDEEVHIECFKELLREYGNKSC